MTKLKLFTQVILTTLLAGALLTGCSKGTDPSASGTPGVSATPTPQGVDLSNVPEEMITEFHKALEDGKDDKAKELLTKEPKLAHTKGEHNRSALQSGASNVSAETMKLIIEAGCPLDATFRESGGWSALHRASYAGNVEHIKLLLESGADIEALSRRDRQTPLQEAAKYGQFEALKVLLEAGADPTVPNRFGRNSLETVQWHLGKQNEKRKAGQEQVIAHLEEVMKTAKPKPDAPVAPDNLSHAAMFADLEKIKKGIEAEPLMIDGYETGGGRTTLLVTAAGSSKLEEAVPVVQYLLDKGSDINADDNTGWTALHRAAREGNLKVMEILLEAGADMEIPDNDERTPLVMAKTAEATKLLLDKGANKDVLAERKKTVLHFAAEWGYLDKVKLLVEMGADTAAETSSGDTPLDLAKKRGKDEVVTFLESQAK